MEGEIAMQGIYAFGFAEKAHSLFDGCRREVAVTLTQKISQNIAQYNFLMRTFDIHTEGMLVFQRVEALQGGEFEGGFGSAFWHVSLYIVSITFSACFTRNSPDNNFGKSASRMDT